MTQAEIDRRADFFLTLRRLGYENEQIGQRFGISGSRVSQIVLREQRRRAQEFAQIGPRLLVVEAKLKGVYPKVISKVQVPLFDTRLPCKIESGGSTQS